MKEIKLTIFTPVYNRVEKIRNLYKSLVNQTVHEFTWMIVDDGSKDNIDEEVEAFLREEKIDIKYYKQKNQGKHVAHNFAVANCTTDFFTCVDSDDILLPNSVEELMIYIDENIDAINKESIAGVLSYKGYSETEKIGSYPKALSPASLSELYSFRGMTGDTFLIFKTKIVKRFPFPVFEGEKFLRESISYDLMDVDHKYLILDKILCICEYCDDGLSKNASRLEVKSPCGAALFRYHEAQKAKSKKVKMRNFTAYVFFSRIGHNTSECRKKLGVRYPLYWLLSFSGYIRYKDVLKARK